MIRPLACLLVLPLHGEPPMTSAEADSAWEEYKRRLAAAKAESEAAWGGVAEMDLARYAAGEATPEERRRVEEAAGKYPKVATALRLLRVALPTEAE